MKIYKTQEDVEKDVTYGVLNIKGDVKFECSISIRASIVVRGGNINCRNINCEDINCGNIDCGNIDCGNIDCVDINCRNINCEDINCGNIDCGNIDCGNIDCGNIDCGDINCVDIDCGDINYYAFCCVYGTIKCLSWKARGDNHKEPICLEGKLIIKDKGKVKITCEGKEVEISRESAKALSLI